ncbi:ATP-grasp domain-containing protein [Actinomycetospora endophytica]|uniref:ATP-grasp domain-containing protein n=1 Tax=Actinomycetospora endophytica TaxID=2291215 RepID=A0ABS8P597_9PSEU|nr:ATP-grasp domain-containing protein [Actinomycetospora endophytica]MCD2193294.1 ATP-grasp domain-containing protein [Actinomycetospora endophytica]
MLLDAHGSARNRVELDRSVPALLLKLGNYPLHHGGVGVVRSLGRCGVDVYAVTEGRFTPAALSRHLHGRFSWPTTGSEDPAELAEGLHGIAKAIGRPAVLVTTDDEAAAVVSELADEPGLADDFLFPRCADPGLPRRVASKEGLFRLCSAHGIPTPMTVFPENLADVEEYAATGAFPVVVKSRDPFERHRHPTVRSSTVVETPDRLRAMALDWDDVPSLILQEYVPRETAEDWVVHAWWPGPDAPGQEALFTGVKLRSWPPHAGFTTAGRARWNDELADHARRLFDTVGFRGIADLDWRRDLRDGRYKLVDFNPRVGAQFRLFEDEAGLDVVRAQHLALTGRPVPHARFPEGRAFVVEDFDYAARVAYRGDRTDGPAPDGRPPSTEHGWFALDDPLPFLPMLVGRASPVLQRFTRTWVPRLRKPR